MSYIKGLGLVGARTRNIERWGVFAGQCMGMMVSPHHRSGISIRVDEYGQRFWIAEGPDESAMFLGWEAVDAAAVGALSDRLSALGVEVHWGSDDELSDRRVERLIKFRDPSGNPHEVYCGAELAHEPFVSPTLRSDFITGDQGLGHCVVFQSDPVRAVDFFRELGFCATDYITEVSGPFKVDLTFMHANRRHHSIGIAPKFGNRRWLDHVMVQVEDFDDVGRAFDRLLDNEFVIDETIGRHPNDDCISFYVRTPSGWRMEMGCAARVVEPGVDEGVVYDRMSTWGHRFTDYSSRFSQ